MGLKVVVVGGSGNVGTAVLDRLAGDVDVSELVGVARRGGGDGPPYDSAYWHAVDLTEPDAAGRLTEVFTGADAVVHLAWAIQPNRCPGLLHATNVEGTDRVCRAVVAAEVPHLLVASSIGSYAPGPRPDRPVGENWPATGIPGSLYSMQKAAVEARLDELERCRPDLVVTRMRPALVFQRRAASKIARYFVGPYGRRPLGRTDALPVLPYPRGIRFQAVHAEDVGDAFASAVLGRRGGAYNLPASGVLDAPAVAAVLGTRTLPVPLGPVATAAALAWRAGLLATSPGWIRMAAAVPLMDDTRARTELGWAPRHTAAESLAELLDGFAERAYGSSPPLRPQPPFPRGLHLPGGPGSR